MKSLIIALLFVALASLSNWLQQRAQAQQQPKPKPPGPRPPGPQPAPPAPEPEGSLQSTLERELRRLLGQDPDVTPKPAPPPVVRRPRQPVQPPPVAATLPRAARGMAAPPLPPPVVLAPAAATTLAPMGEATSGYERAQRLHESVAMRLRRVDTQTEEHRETVPTEALSSPVSSLKGLQGNPAAARQAFIASLVFGPGKWMSPLPAEDQLTPN